MDSRVKTTVDDATFAAAKTLLAQIENSLPFLLGLTAAERRKLAKINVENKTFAENAATAAANNPGLMPPYIDIDGLKKDLVLFRQLDELKALLERLLEKVGDTRILAGSEAYMASLACYKAFEAAAAAGVAGADAPYGLLRERFRKHTTHKALRSQAAAESSEKLAGSGKLQSEDTAE